MSLPLRYALREVLMYQVVQISYSGYPSIYSRLKDT